MTDAAIGGKTGVDLPAGKNLVGAFRQPRLVACHLATLATLPARERRAGFGELWKYALLDGARVVGGGRRLHRLGDAGGPPPGRAPRRHRAGSVAYKAAIVGRDERERTGHRALLNLGHTVGHAIEARRPGCHHGEAVALGLVVGVPGVAPRSGSLRPPSRPRWSPPSRRTGLPADLDPYLTADVLARVGGRQEARRATGSGSSPVREVGACEPAEIAIAELGRILRVNPAP